MQSNGISGVLGGFGVTIPIWFAHVDMAFQAIIATLGFFVLVLTIWNKWLEIKLKRAALEEVEESEHGQNGKG